MLIAKHNFHQLTYYDRRQQNANKTILTGCAEITFDGSEKEIANRYKSINHQQKERDNAEIASAIIVSRRQIKSGKERPRQNRYFESLPPLDGSVDDFDPKLEYCLMPRVGTVDDLEKNSMRLAETETNVKTTESQP